MRESIQQKRHFQTKQYPIRIKIKSVAPRNVHETKFLQCDRRGRQIRYRCPPTKLQSTPRETTRSEGRPKPGSQPPQITTQQKHQEKAEDRQSIFHSLSTKLGGFRNSLLEVRGLCYAMLEPSEPSSISFPLQVDEQWGKRESDAGRVQRCGKDNEVGNGPRGPLGTRKKGKEKAGAAG